MFQEKIKRIKQHRENVRCYVKMENAGEAFMGLCCGFDGEAQCQACIYYVKQEETTYGNKRFTRSEDT